KLVDVVKTKGLMQLLEAPVTTLGPSIFEIFSGKVDALLTQYYGSHYRLQAVTAYRSLSAQEAVRSWLWHSDNYPRAVMKVTLHLTDAGRNQGAMQFLPVAVSNRFRSKGYFGIAETERLEDLGEFARRHSLPFYPRYFEAIAGSVLLFNPTSCLH